MSAQEFRSLVTVWSAVRSVSVRRRIFPCLQLMLKENLAFLKAISAARQSPALLRELRKALLASKEKRTVSSKASGSAKAPTRRQDTKRKASQLGSDSSAEPATRRPAPVQLVRHNCNGGTGCSEQPGAVETSVCRGGGRARCSAAKWAA